MSKRFSFGFFKPNYKNCWQFRAGKLDAQNRYTPLKITIEEMPPINDGQMIPQESLLDIPVEDMMSIVDAIAEALELAGLKQNTQATMAELKAVRFHLDDMRKLALK